MKIILLALLLTFAGPAFGVELASLPPGTVLLSRNKVEADNQSPGLWNHVAIVGKCHIIESQAEPVEGGKSGVIATSFADFEKRGYTPLIALQPLDAAVGVKAADKAETLVGKPFRKLSSLSRRETERRADRGLNCNSVVRASYVAATGEQYPKLKIPDRFLEHPELFKPAVTLTP